MEVISELEADAVLKFLITGLTPEKAVSEILVHRRFYSPVGVKRDVERIRIKYEDANRYAREML